MPLIVLVAISVLACDFTIFMFFQWTFGEKHRGRSLQCSCRLPITPISWRVS